MLLLRSKWRLRSLPQPRPDRAQLANVIPVYRNFSAEEYAIARWLLEHAEPSCPAYLHQLEAARVSGRCDCGCPTVSIFIPPGMAAAESHRFVLPSAQGMIEGRRVSVALLQSKGYLMSLYFRDLDPIRRPYGLPKLESLRPYARSAHPRALKIATRSGTSTKLLNGNSVEMK